MRMPKMNSSIFKTYRVFLFSSCLFRGIDYWVIFILFAIVISLHIDNPFADFGKGISTPSSDSLPHRLRYSQ